MKPSELEALARAIVGKVISPAQLSGPKTPRWRVLSARSYIVKLRAIHDGAERMAYEVHPETVAQYRASGALRITED